MKRDFIWIGIIVGIIGLAICILIAKIEPTTPDNELGIPSTSTTETNTENIQSTGTTDSTVSTKPTDPTEESTNSTLPDTQDPSTPSTEVCAHKNTKTEVIQEVTCHADGHKKIYCKDCGEFIKDVVTKKLPHTLSTDKKDATCEENGEIFDICLVCGFKKTISVINKLGHTEENIIISERTCTSRGEIQTVCSVCKKILNTQYSPQYTHQWIQIADTFPTPFKEGSITYQCYHCEEEKIEKVVFEKQGSYNLCIPALRLNCAITVAECNQSNTDKYDVCCDFNFINQDNPLFFGHNTKTLGKIHKLKKGDIIYFTANDITFTYKVTISEEGELIDGGQNIRGIESGELCISKKEKETLHFFTCHQTPFRPNGRWIVLAEAMF